MAGTQANLAWETLLDLSATRPGPLHMRLAAAIRAAIRAGRLPVGAALPPSRMLAADLSVSRWTVTEAYSQLITEGLQIRYFTAQLRRRTQLTGLIKLFFTTEIRKWVRLRPRTFRIG